MHIYTAELAQNNIDLQDNPATFNRVRAGNTVLFPLDTTLFEALPVVLFFARSSSPQRPTASRLQNVVSAGTAIRLTYIGWSMYTRCPRWTCKQGVTHNMCTKIINLQATWLRKSNLELLSTQLLQKCNTCLSGGLGRSPGNRRNKVLVGGINAHVKMRCLLHWKYIRPVINKALKTQFFAVEN